MEHWIEINLMAETKEQDRVLLRALLPYVRKLRAAGTLVSFHFFREPEIRFRVRVKSRASKAKEARALSEMAESLRRRGTISEWHFGNHGEKGKEYLGEEDRYGKEGWKVAQKYFNYGSETALALLELKRRSALENTLWAKGLGNPWEGGEKNPWREREEDPLVYHWSRYVHLFTNQLGFDIDEEVRLCARQTEGYRRVSEEFGMKW